MKNIKVLIVDDEEELADLLAERLKLRGFEADFATSSSDAIKAVEKNNYDVAIIDVRLKALNGIELMKLIKEIRPQMKVILFTGHGSEEEGHRGLILGASQYLVKPVSLETLIFEIYKVLGRSNNNE